ncbi:EamA family transporter [Natronococcus wangiae]|uniref:EamA family transporter n=1 Tax=Natronococcus wangiae TaxID=3068275 RepID=UPI00273D60B8|nr:EamA family transporter [Natronococcus sp. AD5]
MVTSVGWAIYTVRGKPLIRRYSELETATYSTMLVVPMLAVFVPIELYISGTPIETRVTSPLVAAVLYLGVLSIAVARYCWYKSLEVVDAGTGAVYRVSR